MNPQKENPMPKMHISGYECEVAYIAEYARGPDGTCAFCHGDPCAEYPEQASVNGAAIYNYADERNGRFETCPCCDGRPT